jgi:DNA-binding GntR family transcriptional regulator
MLIEVPTTVGLAGRLDAAAVARLRESAAAIEARAAAGDLIGYVDADREFHLTLLGHAGNQRLVDLVAELRSRARLSGLRRLADSGRLLDSAREHADLVDALERGDPVTTESIVRQHIGHVRGIWAAP